MQSTMYKINRLKDNLHSIGNVANIYHNNKWGIMLNIVNHYAIHLKLT